ncbi:right-handed parallel beta-helix repeat-containing protein [Massilia sp. YIM B02769]|uniref:right-handed parallel beta-helix repeat-containing protein n=1 Tax=Massilia sp. YIM B02769 TaxID=3050129 RepID=UPI0025B6A66B|nr:right-handed parallel beta-helix repeat-containing protein [Massilia sp. YIM B02769]
MKRLSAALALLALLCAGLLACALAYLQSQGVTPRALAPYLLHRTSGHNELIEAAGRVTAGALLRLDRGGVQRQAMPPLVVGARPEAPPAPGGNERVVASVEAARQAFGSAVPGDIITFLPGSYTVKGTLFASRPGLDTAPIVVRAARPGTVEIRFDAAEGFSVSAPYWRFENLGIRGACRYDDNCQHAFHVVGRAHHFVARNNTLVDFNAHFKINGEKGAFPDFGLIEANTLSNTGVRRTARPVTPVDLVGASDWTVRANIIRDFVKGSGDRISYGAFAKGGAQRTVFERNVVLCEEQLLGERGQRIGLSFGGGGTGKPYCRDRQCITEHEDGIMRANLVAGCADVGIYLNSAARSRIVDNTLLDTAGVQVRFPTSSAALEGNLVDGPIRSDAGGSVRAGDNLATPIWQLYLGRHPQRALFGDVAARDLRWRGQAPARAGSAEAGLDLCGKPWGGAPAYGAFQDFAACIAGRATP